MDYFSSSPRITGFPCGIRFFKSFPTAPWRLSSPSPHVGAQHPQKQLPDSDGRCQPQAWLGSACASLAMTPSLREDLGLACFGSAESAVFQGAPQQLGARTALPEVIAESSQQSLRLVPEALSILPPLASLGTVHTG